LTSATLRVVPAAQHGIASAGVVVARMIGMLVGIAALSAWGLYRFNQYLQERLAAIPAPPADTPGGMLIAQGARLQRATVEAYTMQYGEIFKITAIVCVVGALLGLLIAARAEHSDAPDAPAATAGDDDAPTTTIEAPTQAISRSRADETVRIQQQQQPPGRHRPR